MQADLKTDWGIEATVLYDRPNPQLFKPLSLKDKYDLFERLKLGKNCAQNHFVEFTNGEYKSKP